jgi:acetate kinase
MGYSPLEGVVMATRSGTIDWTAARVLKNSLNLDDNGLEDYLNRQSGLLGLSGSSSDIRELLQKESEGDHYAGLALKAYVFSVQKAIGQMSAVLGGVDLLAFTGTVGERSVPIRERIVKPLHYLDLELDTATNEKCSAPENPTLISRLAQSKPIFVVPADEATEIAYRTTLR